MGVLEKLPAQALRLEMLNVHIQAQAGRRRAIYSPMAVMVLS